MGSISMARTERKDKRESESLKDHKPHPQPLGQETPLKPTKGFKGPEGLTRGAPTSASCEGKLDGVPSDAAEGVYDQLTTRAALLQSEGDVLSNSLWSHREPALCNTNTNTTTG